MNEQVLKAAQEYLSRGWAPIPIPRGEKAPQMPRWSGAKFAAEDLPHYFEKYGDNVGILLGEPSNGLVDVDLDCPQTMRLAATFLPETPAKFGRASKRTSHWLYIIEPVSSTAQFEAPAGAAVAPGTMLVELRSTGGQTVFPPSVHPSGEDIEWEGPLEPAAVDPDLLRVAVARLAAAALLAREWPAKGSRDDTAMALAGALIRGGWSDTEADEFIIAVADTAGDEEAATRGKGQQTATKIAAGLEVTGWPRLAELIGEKVIEKVRLWLGMRGGAEGYNLTDLGNAERLVERFGETIRYNRAARDWLIWDGSRWKRDKVQLIGLRAKETLRGIYDEAMRASDPEARNRILKHAFKCESGSHLNKMIEFAQFHVPVTPEDLDRDPWLLNVINGTIDLRTGELRDHVKEDFMTKMCPVEYDPRAKSDRWEKYLRDATGDDKEMMEWLQMAAGYSLTGSTQEEVLFFINGPSQSGKSTFVGALKETLGDYAGTADFDSFIDQKYRSGPRNDIAKLIGTRFVSSVEVDEGKKLAEALVKEITGGDEITARFLYQDFIDFTPTFKLWLVANHKPDIRDDDDAIWRRVRVVPFDHSIPDTKRDDSLKAALMDPTISGAALLAWAVEGCVRWQREGLKRVPKRIEEASKVYRQEMDTAKDFWSECVEFTRDDNWTSRTALTAVYKQYCEENGIARSKRWSNRRVKQYLKDMGVQERTKHGSRHGYIGLKLLVAIPSQHANGNGSQPVTPEDADREERF